MASDAMSVAVILEYGFFFLTYFHTFTATGMEFTTLGRISRRRNISFEDYTFYLRVRVGYGYRREQRLRIGVHRISANVLFLSVFHHIS